MSKILLTGATGYIGGRLLKILEAQNQDIRCLARVPRNLESIAKPTTQIVMGDVFDQSSLKTALSGIQTAFYLVHSMGASEDFSELDRKGAENFARIASEQGVQRIIYLGGLGEDSQDLSLHLKSRHEVGKILRESGKGVTVIEFRASIVIGSGSLSFEMIRALCERLPFMITPKWVWTSAQPIAINDLLKYLIAAIDLPLDHSEVYEIGGSDVVTYGALMEEYSRQRGLHRLMISVPVLSPRLSSLWLGLITPLYARVGRKLVDSASYPTVVSDDKALKTFHFTPVGHAEAIATALRNEDQEFAATRWTDPISSATILKTWSGDLFGNRLVDSKVIELNLPEKDAFAPIRTIGGDNGWYSYDFLWQIRGYLDTLVGGVGMRRARRDPESLKVGDVIDFWRVESYIPDKLLRLQAEMKMPGRAWLQFEVEERDGRSAVRQTAIFDPIGVSGLLYWYGLYPVHHLIFNGMLKQIGEKAMEGKDLEAVKETHEYFVKKCPLPVPSSEAFAWHSREGAFERLLAPWENVKIVERTGGIQNGARTVLQLKAFIFHFKWVLTHLDYREGQQFCDMQASGPFAYWKHKHKFIPEPNNNSILEDNIAYKVPFGMVGHLFAISYLKGKLEKLFRYRHEVTFNDLYLHNRFQGKPRLRILIAGSTGLVGSNLVPFLTTGGHEVHRLVRKKSGGSREILWDPAKEQINPSELEGFDAIINLAGDGIANGRWSDKKKREILESRTQTTRLLAQTLSKLTRKPKVWINASAVGIYGDSGDVQITEESPLGKGFLADVCQAWEASTLAAEDCGIRVVKIRIGVVLSAKGGALKEMLLPFKLGIGGVIGSGGQYMSWIAIDDLLGVINEAMMNESYRGPVNAVSPNSVTNTEFTKTLGAILHRPTVLPMPAFAARGVFGEVADALLLSSCRVEPAVLNRGGYKFLYPHLELALNHLL